MLTVLAAAVPPRIAHTIARWLGYEAVIAVFCQGCPAWTDETETETEDAAA